MHNIVFAAVLINISANRVKLAWLCHWTKCVIQVVSFAATLIYHWAWTCMDALDAKVMFTPGIKNSYSCLFVYCICFVFWSDQKWTTLNTSVNGIFWPLQKLIPLLAVYCPNMWECLRKCFEKAHQKTIPTSLRKKATKTVTGVAHFQKVNFCTSFIFKGCILVCYRYIVIPKWYINGAI